MKILENKTMLKQFLKSVIIYCTIVTFREKNYNYLIGNFHVMRTFCTHGLS